MAVQGVFASDSGIVGDQKQDFESFVTKLAPSGDFPFFKLSAGMKSERAEAAIVNWFEENYVSGEVQLNGAITTETAFVLDDSSTIVPGDIMQVVPSGEYIYVTANVTATNTITVVRGFAGTTAASIADNAKIQKITHAREENSNRPVAITYLGQPMYNYTQIIRSAWGISRTAKNVAFHTGNPLAKRRQDAAWQHAVNLERALLWGKKTWGVQNGQPFRTMDGILTQIKTNVTVAGATTTRAQFEDFLESAFKYNLEGFPNERICFLDNKALRVLNDIAWANSTFNMESTSKVFGMDVRSWKSPFGDISLMTHPMMNEGTNWRGHLYLIHPGSVVKKVMQPTLVETYDKDSGTDGDSGGLTTELSVIYKGERTGAKLTGLTAAAAS